MTPGDKAPPLERGWQQRATSDPNRVLELWRKEPRANPGVATGRGLVVVDCDSDEAVSHAHELGVAEETPTVATPSGGRHYYLAGEAPNRARIAPGLDLRARGGYAVGAGGRRSDGVYKWIVPPWEAEHAPLPPGLERLIRERSRSAKPHTERGQGSHQVEVVTQGERNNFLMRKGAAMKRAGLPFDAIKAALTALNPTACVPPLDEAEVERIAKNCARMREPSPWLDPWALIRSDERLSHRAGSSSRRSAA
ncbi:MAG TPA: bifunctional DNA primase/polymerase, partial [Thermoleophilaceae bacterium]|nr:bifunctional DNA primase/polymerase [Thermoleophilaceae bacterium]